MSAPVHLAGGMKEEFDEQGFVILRDALEPAELDELRTEAAAICRGDLGEFEGVAAAQADMPDDDVLRNYLCIHFPHKISSVMRRHLAHPAIVDGLTEVIGPDVKAMQSMLFIKPSGKPGQAWHQDEYFIPTRDRSLTAAWIALDDATTENGCLWVIPGSHAPGVIYPQRDHETDLFDCSGEAYRFPYTDDDAVPVELEAGSVLLFNGYLLHRSHINRAAPGTFRRALVNHYMSASSLLPWGRDDEPVGRRDHRDVVLVAGTDPYAWKGTTEVVRPHVRPSGDGGCEDFKKRRRTGRDAESDATGGT